MSRRRQGVLGALAALVVAIGLVACGSNDNGGVIQPGTTAPGSPTTTASSSGY